MDSTEYNVYALVDGAVYDEESFESINDAYGTFDALVVSYRADAKLGILGGDATIHLYDPFYGNILAEAHVSATNLDIGELI